ncbi:unnamed protein product [Camellia sinensis]
MFLLLSSADVIGKMTNNKRKLIIGYNSSEHTPAAELIGSNADILTEILTCVPAKFLIRFKCVSRDWLSLISDSQFSCNHSHRDPNALFSGLFINPCTSDNAQVKSVSLNGHHRSLPTVSFLNGVGDGSVLPYPYHGGTTSSSVQFHLKFGVFWSSSGSLGIVFWNGAIHWMSYGNIYIRLDVDAQKLIGTPMPSYPKILSEEKIWYFGECCGHLLLVQLCQCCAMGFKILEMERDCCHWM